MCIIVDTNNIARVFNPKNSEHFQYEPVFKWIVSGKGKLIIGGTTFNNEILKNKWFLPFLGQLSRINKVIRVKDEYVDKVEKEISAMIPTEMDFDDPHIISLLKISKCKLICSDDKRAYSYFTSRGIFTKGSKPKIYSNLKNAELLKDKNIASCCKPINKLNKKQIDMLSDITGKYRS